MGLVLSALTVFGILTFQDDIAKSAFNPENPQLLPGAGLAKISGQPNGGKEGTKGQLRTVTGVVFSCWRVSCLLVFRLAAHILLLESASCGSMAIYDTPSKQMW